MRGERLVSAYQTAVRTADAVERVRDLGGRAARGGKMAARAIVGMHREARRGRMREVHDHLIAGDLFHGDGDRRHALAQLSTEWLGLAGDVLHDAQTSPEIAQWAQTQLVPSLVEWEAFHRNELAGWTHRLVTSWSTFERWSERVKRLREAASMRGVKLTSPEPVDLPKTIWQKGEEGQGSGADVLWTLLKTVVYMAVGVTGVVTLYAVARDVRGHVRGGRS